MIVASSNKCNASSNKKLVVTGYKLLGLDGSVPHRTKVVHVACGGGQQGCTGAVTLHGELYTFGVLVGQSRLPQAGTAWPRNRVPSSLI